MRRILSLLIVAVLLLLLPADILALGVSGEQSEPTRVRQLEELRETNSDTYLLSDGRYECVVYAEDKYYKDGNGNFAEIDHSIVKAQQTRSGKRYDYKNAAGGVDVYFSSNTPSVYIEANGKSIAFSMLEARCINGANPGGSSEKRSVSAYALYGENFIAYENVLADTDVIYQMTNGSLKEYILLKTPSAPSEFAFLFDAKDLIARKTEAGIIEFASPSGEEVFELGSLFAVDSNGEYTEALEYTVEETGKTGEYRITVSLSADYLKAPERAFPVLVDPSVDISGSSKTKDTFVSQNNPNANYYLKTFLFTGKNAQAGYGVCWSYIKFDLPSSVMGKRIDGAYIKIRKKSGAAPSVKAYRVTTSWVPKETKWSNKPSALLNDPLGPAVHTSNNWYTVYITKFANLWCSNTYPNNGVLLRETNESSSSQWTEFYSSDSSYSPQLRIIYSASNHYANLLFGMKKENISPGVPPDVDPDQDKLYNLNKLREVIDAAFQASGYGGIAYSNEVISASIVSNLLKERTMLAWLTHGEPANNSHPARIKLTGNNKWFTIADLNAIPAQEMAQLKFVYCGSCHSGNDGSGATNFVNTLRSKGVETVVGFKGLLNVDVGNVWTCYFMSYIANGYSVQTAMNEADDDTEEYMQSYPGIGNDYSYMGENRYWVGKGNLVPCP